MDLDSEKSPTGSGDYSVTDRENVQRVATLESSLEKVDEAEGRSMPLRAARSVEGDRCTSASSASSNPTPASQGGRAFGPDPEEGHNGKLFRYLQIGADEIYLSASHPRASELRRKLKGISRQLRELVRLPLLPLSPYAEEASDDGLPLRRKKRNPSAREKEAREELFDKARHSALMTLQADNPDVELLDPVIADPASRQPQSAVDPRRRKLKRLAYDMAMTSAWLAPSAKPISKPEVNKPPPADNKPKKRKRSRAASGPAGKNPPPPKPGDLSPAQKWVALKSEFRGVGLFHKPRTPEERRFRRRFDVLERTYGKEGCFPVKRVHPRDSRRRPAEKTALRKLSMALAKVITSRRRNNS